MMILDALCWITRIRNNDYCDNNRQLLAIVILKNDNEGVSKGINDLNAHT